MTWEDYNYLDVQITRWLDDPNGPKLTEVQQGELLEVLDVLRAWLSAHVD